MSADKRLSDLENRIAEQEKTAQEFSKKLYEIISQAAANNQTVASLNIKFDAFRDDMRDLRKILDGLVPRSEIDIRIDANVRRIEVLERMADEFRAQISGLRDDLGKVRTDITSTAGQIMEKLQTQNASRTWSAIMGFLTFLGVMTTVINLILSHR